MSLTSIRYKFSFHLNIFKVFFWRFRAIGSDVREVNKNNIELISSLEASPEIQHRVDHFISSDLAPFSAPVPVSGPFTQVEPGVVGGRNINK